MSFQVVRYELTIPSGSSATNPIPISGHLLLGFVLLNNITGSGLVLQARPTSSDSFYRVHNFTGAPFALYSGYINGFVPLPRDLMTYLVSLDSIRFVNADANYNPTNATANIGIRAYLAPV
jgi:hypothetical protein